MGPREKNALLGGGGCQCASGRRYFPSVVWWCDGNPTRWRCHWCSGCAWRYNCVVGYLLLSRASGQSSPDVPRAQLRGLSGCTGKVIHRPRTPVEERARPRDLCANLRGCTRAWSWMAVRRRRAADVRPRPCAGPLRIPPVWRLTAPAYLESKSAAVSFPFGAMHPNTLSQNGYGLIPGWMTAWMDGWLDG